MATLTITGLHKSFGKTKALDGIELAVPDGELCVVVGPSGSGKTSLLRAIAGIEKPDAGTIAFDGEVVNDLGPRDRNVALVPQKPLLFPHLTVHGNVAFGLRARRVPRAEMAQKVESAADLAGIAGQLGRYPRQLTEGETQRVAIAHALVRDALLFLLDEPLARLDAMEREAMRAAFKRQHEKKPTTTIYVTQDQMEAMNIADRVIVMRGGRVEQAGAPIELFERPASRFVAGFFGPLKMNFLTGTLMRRESGDIVRLAEGAIDVPLPPGRLTAGAVDGARVILGVRPEHMLRAVRVSPPDGTLRYDAVVDLLQPNGTRTRATFRMGGEPIVAELQAHDVSATGEKISIDINLKRATLFDAETEKALTPIAEAPAS